jgi:hypothetical protein
MMDAIRFLNLLWRAPVAWFALVPDRALAFAPAFALAADDVDSCAVMLRFGQFSSSSE